MPTLCSTLFNLIVLGCPFAAQAGNPQTIAHLRLNHGLSAVFIPPWRPSLEINMAALQLAPRSPKSGIIPSCRTTPGTSVLHGCTALKSFTLLCWPFENLILHPVVLWRPWVRKAPIVKRTKEFGHSPDPPPMTRCTRSLRKLVTKYLSGSPRNPTS
ncbi:hypothetical protein BXZ70DRAFT_631939 [Cristinia sonorae]|uniref:Secreted protein n=1 Tax=Cristinia sonorae TaxID=1940300 RepID=A0A8K0XKD8_9AGAR|nr:hypothetical protein BXZ70DRAFT_631939 [Cristinia sonorae]